MGAWLSRLWTDSDFFTHAVLSAGRLGMVFLGWAFEQGLIPTGVDNGGKKLGPALVLLSAFVGRVRAGGSGPPSGAVTAAGQHATGDR